MCTHTYLCLQEGSLHFLLFLVHKGYHMIMRRYIKIDYLADAAAIKIMKMSVNKTDIRSILFMESDNVQKMKHGACVTRKSGDIHQMRVS